MIGGTVERDDRVRKARLHVAAAVAGVHADTIKRWQDAGDLTLHRTRGGHRRVDLTELRALLAKWKASK